MANRFAGAMPVMGMCKGCGTEQPLFGCRDQACPTNQPWISPDQPATSATNSGPPNKQEK